MYALEISSRSVTYRPGHAVNTDDFVYLLEEPDGAERLARFLAQLGASEAASLVAQTTLSLQALRRGNHELHYQLSRALLDQFRRDRSEQLVLRNGTAKSRH